MGNVSKWKAAIQACDLCPPLTESGRGKKENRSLCLQSLCTNSLEMLEKHRKSYPPSQHVAFALQPFEFLTWHGLLFLLFFFSNCLELRKRVSFLRTVSLHTELCRTLQRCRCRPDWVFVGPVNTPDSAECRRSECVKWEKQGETVEMRPVCKSRWMAWSQPLTSC